MSIKNCLLPVVLVLAFASLSFADIDVENDNSDVFKISGYFDGCIAEWGAYNTTPSREIFIRRSGVEINSDLTESIFAEMKVEMRPDEMFLKNAFVGWSPNSNISARFGQFKKENLLAGSISTWNLNMFDRPQVYTFCEDLNYSGRDLGYDLSIKLPEFNGIEMSGTAGVFNGDERAEERDNNELLYTVRGEIAIPSVNLTLGTSVAAHREGIEDATPDGYSSSERQTAVSADLAYTIEFSNWYEFGLTGEYATGDNWEQADVIGGDEAPSYESYWGTASFTYKPWNTSGINAISLSVTLDKLIENTEFDYYSKNLSIVAAVYPTEYFRFRFGAVAKDVLEFMDDASYTDYITEIGIRF